MTGLLVHTGIRCGDIVQEDEVDDGCIARHMCEECNIDEIYGSIDVVGCKVVMRRYHIVIEGYPTETVLAKDVKEAFLKSSFHACEPNKKHNLLIYEALEGEPDYRAGMAGFCPDETRKPVAGQQFTIKSKNHGVKNHAR